MFRPYKVILRSSKNTVPRVELLDLSKHVALTKYTILVYKQSVVLSTDALYLYVITLRDGKHKQNCFHGKLNAVLKVITIWLYSDMGEFD